MTTNKMTLKELEANKQWEEAVIVFTPDSFNKDYTLEERSYQVSNDAKYFDPKMNGKSLHGNCLDGSEFGVRLDIYMHNDDGKQWKVDYCYITEMKPITATEKFKALVEKAMKERLICSQKEAEAAIEFVVDLLAIDIDQTEELEPWATTAIEEMKVSISRVEALKDLL